MQNVVLMITIAKRSMSEEYISYFEKNNINMTLGKYATGTAANEMLEYLGIGDREKCILFSTMTNEKSKKILEDFKVRFGIMKAGEGIAFTIPISSVSSKKALDYLVTEIDNNKEEGYIMETEFESIFVIANRGYTDKVMEAAREAGAHGGTVMHARGTGVENAEKFFGTTIGAEKEIIIIVAKREERNKIMQSIKEKAGINTEAQAIMFSLPVSDVAGIGGK
ncbi:MAG: P-II family nitrogen regulator [Clostridia bacterium]|nr:P-II family nitrogen regulator [Clostridia bacterium]